VTGQALLTHSLEFQAGTFTLQEMISFACR
jgi:hypothetical protein